MIVTQLIDFLLCNYEINEMEETKMKGIVYTTMYIVNISIRHFYM